MNIDKAELVKEAKLELARRDFFYYTKVKAPDFYKDDREYLITLCKALQEFLNDDNDILVMNIPPRHGKSRTSQLFVEWALGKNQTLKIMTGSYNETVATQFSKGVRNSISEIKADKDKVVYSDIFPGVRIKQGDASANLWSLEGGYTNYLATSPTGTATGFGADILIIDDVIRNAEEANNQMVLDRHWEWYLNTMLSRLEQGGKQIIIMTRWHSKDLAGRILDEMPKNGYRVKHISMKAYDKDKDSTLCEEVLSKEDYLRKVKSMGEDIASANYQQEPIDLKGKLYTEFKTYKELPDKDSIKAIKMYSDTADKGDDYLCNIIYAVTMSGEFYILDVYYTQEPMEITEKETAARLIKYDVAIADIESNNGGRGFGRAVKRELKDKGWRRTKINMFHQSDNKEARILTNAPRVMDMIYFPWNWRDKWPEFYLSMNSFQRQGKNVHDDAQDAITGVIEKGSHINLYSFG